jgi:ferrous iron transport protein A
MVLNKETPVTLGDLMPGESAEIVGFEPGSEGEAFLLRLLEVGFLPGETVEILNESPFGQDPIGVRVKEGVYALRRAEVRNVRVRRIGR